MSFRVGIEATRYTRGTSTSGRAGVERWLGFVRTDPDVEGGWHVHGERDSYIYVRRGSISIDFGPGGRARITAHSGDFISNPARMVHREVTGNEPGELIVMRLGPGRQVVNVEGPDAG